MVLFSPIRTMFVIGALTFVTALATAVPARAAEKAVWGPTRLPDGSSAFELYDELGVDTLQLSINWAAVASSRPAAPNDPADPVYRWPPEIAAAAAEAAARGMNLALLVAQTPPWANGGRDTTWVPSNPQDFADFMTAAARRYPSVRRWMIWGEPSKADRFQPNAIDDPVGARAYAPLLDAAYAALKGVSPRNIVIGGMTWTGDTVKPPDFVRWMRLPDGRPPRLDWFGHNPFPYRFPDLGKPPQNGFRDMSDVDTLGDEVDEAYGRTARDPVPLWLSEYTMQSDRGSAVFATFVSEHDQARYVVEGYKIADELGAQVAGLGWFALLDEPVAPGSANWGVLTHGLRRKPAFDALKNAPSVRRRSGGAGTVPDAPDARPTARAPRITGLRLSPTTLRAARSGASVKRGLGRTGTRVSYRLDMDANVWFMVQRISAGRRIGRRCVKQSSRNRRRRSCIRHVAVRGSFTRRRLAGADSFIFSARMADRALKVGRYRLVATASASGRKGSPARRQFRISRRG
jgi:hypothetical protein